MPTIALVMLVTFLERRSFYRARPARKRIDGRDRVPSPAKRNEIFVLDREFVAGLYTGRENEPLYR
jgi:hypothetical protein